MPSRTKVDADTVLKALEEHGGHYIKTANALGIHYQTVRKYYYLARGLCACGNPLDKPNRLSCSRCLATHRRRNNAKYEKLVEARMCVACHKPLAPNSDIHCPNCLAKSNIRKQAYKRRLGRLGKWGYRVVRRYGQDAIEAYETSKGKCQACDAPEPPNRRHDIHHIDGDDTNNIRENFAILCVNCHAIITKLHALTPDARDRLLVIMALKS